jgi:hypothetical protein
MLAVKPDELEKAFDEWGKVVGAVGLTMGALAQAWFLVRNKISEVKKEFEPVKKEILDNKSPDDPTLRETIETLQMNVEEQGSHMDQMKSETRGHFKVVESKISGVERQVDLLTNNVDNQMNNVNVRIANVERVGALIQESQMRFQSEFSDIRSLLMRILQEKK